MANLVGVFVDNKYNIFVRQGDSGAVVIKGIPDDNTYKVSLGIVDPDSGSIVKEISTYASSVTQVAINITTQQTESLNVGKYLYGIKLTVGDSETTVIPNAYKNAGGCLSIPLPPTFNILPKLVEG